MKISVKANVRLDIPKQLKRVRSPKLWKYAAQQWHRLYKDYVPMDQGVLYNQVLFDSNETEGTITHTVPYAHYMYEGRVYGPNYPVAENDRVVGYFSQKGRPKKPTGRMLKYDQQKHSKATRKWDQAAVPTQGPKLLHELQKFVDRGKA